MTPAERTQSIRFPIAGMTCTACVSRITRTLRKVDGVDRVRVDLVDESATVRRDPSRADDLVITAAVRAAGYEADLSRAVELPLEELAPSFLDRFIPRHRRTSRSVGDVASTKENVP